MRATAGPLVLVGYRGDAKTLLAFDLPDPASRACLAGFTVEVAPPAGDRYFLHNNLRFQDPAQHAQDPREPPFSTLNAPLHKFRWVHVPGMIHQGLTPAFGTYRYTVTARYFGDRQQLLPLDPANSASIEIEVAPFVQGKVALGFTRGFVQSQAFVRRFGLHTPIRPKGSWRFDTGTIAGANDRGEQFTFAQAYDWLGFTARRMIFDLLDDVIADPTLSIDVFAYDLNEPDFVDRLLTLAAQRRARLILDDSPLHHRPAKPRPEDEIAEMFAAAAGPDRIRRGHFGRYAHMKVLVVRNPSGPLKVLTGSTNFSVTGLYVNSNHVILFDDVDIAADYARVFDQVLSHGFGVRDFADSDLGRVAIDKCATANLPSVRLSFSPHRSAFASQLLGAIVDRIKQEPAISGELASVLFAVMELGGPGRNPVYEALAQLHESGATFSLGISDDPVGIALYPVGRSGGVLVTGKPVRTRLPSPFSQVPNLAGAGHQIHHKLVVCGFNGPDPTVVCGSSNLAQGGEQANGDNLITIHDSGIATAFAIEALALVDHFNFLDGVATRSGQRTAPTLLQDAAVGAGWFLGTTDAWAKKFFDTDDLHCRDRALFASPTHAYSKSL